MIKYLLLIFLSLSYISDLNAQNEVSNQQLTEKKEIESFFYFQLSNPLSEFQIDNLNLLIKQNSHPNESIIRITNLTINNTALKIQLINFSEEQCLSLLKTFFKDENIDLIKIEKVNSLNKL